MSKITKNHKLFKYENNDNADLTFLSDTMDTIDKGLTLDVGTSTGTGNNYILDIGSITLAESNKGISFKFFADKDSTGAVTINTNYNLIKANKNTVKNLKSGAPYIITYDGGLNFFLASGSDESDSTSVGTDGSNVKVGETFIGSDGEIHTGTFTADGTITASDVLSGKIGYSKGNKITGGMTNRGAINATLGINGNYTIPQGYHNGQGKISQSIATQGGSTTTPGTANKTIVAANRYVTGDIKVLGDSNLIASNIISGKSIFGVSGNAKMSQSATGTQNVYGATAGTVYSINCGFQPSAIYLKGDIIAYKNSWIDENNAASFRIDITSTGFNLVYTRSSGSSLLKDVIWFAHS
ncbi:MAG: hypothetical protein ACLSTJ_07705 [Clostridium neonatale]